MGRFTNIPEAMASADKSLSAVVTVTLEENLSHTYEQSCWGLGLVCEQNALEFTTVVPGAWEPYTYLHYAFPMPVPLRPTRTGQWRNIEVRARIKGELGHDLKVRAYLLERPYVNASHVIADPEGFGGVMSFDEVDATCDDAFHDYTFTIDPDESMIPCGEGLATAPIAWLVFIVQSSAATKYRILPSGIAEAAA